VFLLRRTLWSLAALAGTFVFIQSLLGFLAVAQNKSLGGLPLFGAVVFSVAVPFFELGALVSLVAATAVHRRSPWMLLRVLAVAVWLVVVLNALVILLARPY
jgi:hypothetical protein